jgi:hypothetical protein
MSELLKVLQNLPPPRVRKHFVTIDGIKIEVSREKKTEILKHGEINYRLEGNQAVLKPRSSKKNDYPVLQKADKGFVFEQGDIHWPNGVAEGGEKWLIKSE